MYEFAFFYDASNLQIVFTKVLIFKLLFTISCIKEKANLELLISDFYRKLGFVFFCSNKPKLRHQNQSN